MPSSSHGILHECADCGLFSRLDEPVAGTDMHCVRCDNLLRRVHGHSLDPARAFNFAALFFYVIAVTSPLLQIILYGHSHVGVLSTGPLKLDDLGFWLLASVVFLTTIVMPMIRILGMMVVLHYVRMPDKPVWVSNLYAFLQHLAPWSMIEVYLLGFMVAYTRLQQFAHVQLGMAVIGLIGLMVTMVATDSCIDPEAIWESIKKRGKVDVAAIGHKGVIGCDTCHQVSHAEEGQACPRCGDILHLRKLASLSRAWALALGAVILYLPSNIFPIMTVTRLGKTESYTIFGGIQELAHIGLWPLALLVFVASIAIPVFKLMTLLYMLIETQRGSASQLASRTRLYRVIDFIGRWSMVDVYMVSILVALVRFGWFANVTPSAGVVYFASVVVLTMLAVMSFDPRLMWDVAGMQKAKTRPSDKRLTA